MSKGQSRVGPLRSAGTHFSLNPRASPHQQPSYCPGSGADNLSTHIRDQKATFLDSSHVEILFTISLNFKFSSCAT